MTPTNQKIRLAVAGKRRLIRDFISNTIVAQKRIEIVGEAENLKLAIDIARRHKPNVIILDIALTEFDLFEILPEISKASKRTRALILAPSLDDNYIYKLIKAGARGYISTVNASTADFISAIKAVEAGEFWIERKMAAKLLDIELHKKNNNDISKTKHILSKREIEVITYLAKGFSNKEIAAELFISEKTVKSHINHIFKKLKISRRIEALMYAVNQGFVKPSEFKI